MKKDVVPSSPPAAYVPNAVCPHHGEGGSYTYDPATGLRTRVDEPTAGFVAPVVKTEE